jgi:hypothetical protein
VLNNLLERDDPQVISAYNDMLNDPNIISLFADVLDWEHVLLWKGWEFCQKREPSMWVTFSILRIFKRIGELKVT